MITSDAMQILRAKPDDAVTLTHIAISAKGHWGYPEKWMPPVAAAFERGFARTIESIVIYQVQEGRTAKT